MPYVLCSEQWVHSNGGLIQDQQGWLLKHGHCKRHSSLLTATVRRTRQIMHLHSTDTSSHMCDMYIRRIGMHVGIVVQSSTVLLTSNLSVYACPLVSDSKAARMRRPRYSRVNIRVHASAMRATCVCARVTSARSTRKRVSIASIPRPLPPRKKVEGLGTRLACPLHMNLVHAFKREHVRVRVLACTHVQHARAVKLLVSGTVHQNECTKC